MEDGLPTGPPEDVGESADETVKPSPVGIGVFTELPLGDCGAWEDCTFDPVFDEVAGPCIDELDDDVPPLSVLDVVLDVGDAFFGLPEVGEVKSEVDCLLDVRCLGVVVTEVVKVVGEVDRWLDVCLFGEGVERFMSEVIGGLSTEELGVEEVVVGLPTIGEVVDEDVWELVSCPGRVLYRLVVDGADGFRVGGGGSEVGMFEGSDVSIDESSEVSMDEGGEVGMVKGGNVSMDEGGKVGMVKEVNMDEGSKLDSIIEGRSPEPGPDSLLGGEGLEASDETLVARPLSGGPKVVGPF